jgi:hypothetical protein
LTGIAPSTWAVQPKLLQLLNEAMPGMKRAAFHSFAGDPNCETAWARLEPARQLGLQMQKVELASAGRFAPHEVNGWASPCRARCWRAPTG